jgi:integrase
MARTVRNAKLDSRSARTKLSERREPYWVVIAKGCALGYRKGAKGGTWIARFRGDTGKQQYNSLGAADDAMDSDGLTVLSYAEAQRKADDWFKLAARDFEEEAPQGKTSAFTVKDAMALYMTAYARKGGKAADRTQWAIDAQILPSLGNIAVAKLSRRRIVNWHDALSKAPPRLRTKIGKPQKFREIESTPETERRRRSTANRLLTILKAGLNFAYSERQVASDEAWRPVKAFREVDSARIRYLSDDESRRLVNATAPDFRPMVQAALLTGCRYGELAALQTADFNPDAGTIHIRVSKSGKARHVVLTVEGQNFFATATAGKQGDARIFTRTDGAPWGTSHQQRPFKAACERAKLGALTFHELRHSYASRLAMQGVPLAVIAAQLGHTDTRTSERHYAHLSPSFVADTVRAAFSTLGVVGESKILPMTSP